MTYVITHHSDRYLKMNPSKERRDANDIRIFSRMSIEGLSLNR